jgi:type 1 fimbria pilin
MRVGLRSIVLLSMLVMLAGACGSGENSSPAPTAPTPTPPPSAPPAPTPPPSNSCLPSAATNLSVTQNLSTRVLTWTAGAKATDYDIQIGFSSGASDIVRDNTTHTDYTWTGGGSGTNGTFYARVHSHNSCGSGPASAELVFH